VESVDSTPKVELIHRHAWPTRAQARQAVFEYVEVSCNRQRLHSTLGYMTPAAYETCLTSARRAGATLGRYEVVCRSGVGPVSQRRIEACLRIVDDLNTEIEIADTELLAILRLTPGPTAFCPFRASGLR